MLAGRDGEHIGVPDVAVSLAGNFTEGRPWHNSIEIWLRGRRECCWRAKSIEQRSHFHVPSDSVCRRKFGVPLSRSQATSLKDTAVLLMENSYGS